MPVFHISCRRPVPVSLRRMPASRSRFSPAGHGICKPWFLLCHSRTRPQALALVVSSGTAVLYPWLPPGEGDCSMPPYFLVPAGLPFRTYCHGHICPARTIGAAPRFGNTSFFPYTRQHSQSPLNQSRTSGERANSLSIHVSLCRQDCLPAHIAMVVPVRRGG